jgi:hypothetical protein
MNMDMNMEMSNEYTGGIKINRVKEIDLNWM